MNVAIPSAAFQTSTNTLTCPTAGNGASRNPFSGLSDFNPLGSEVVDYLGKKSQSLQRPFRLQRSCYVLALSVKGLKSQSLQRPFRLQQLEMDWNAIDNLLYVAIPSAAFQTSTDPFENCESIHICQSQSLQRPFRLQRPRTNTA